MKNRVLVCSTEFPPLPGGIGAHAHGLIKELSKDYEISLLTEVRGSKEHFLEFINENLTIQKATGVERHSWTALTYYNRIKEFFKAQRNKSHVIYSGKFYVWCSNFSSNDQKSILVIHGSELKQKGISKWLFSRALRKAAKVVCVSNYTKKKLFEYYKESINTKTVVINNGFVGTSKNLRNMGARSSQSKINLLTIGGVHKRKGQQNVIQALPAIIKLRFNPFYNMVGLTIEKAFMKEIALDSEMVEKISFTGAVNEEDKWNAIDQSDIFLMLSEELENGDFEGFGIALMEAMSRGVPVIGSRNSGIADAIKDKVSGLLVDPKNPEEVAGAVKEIMSNYESYSAGSLKWSKNFTWMKIGAEYKQLIDTL